MRLFIAVRLPATAKNEAREFIKRVKNYSPPASVRWVKNKNLHITLKFLGETGINIEKIKKELIPAAGKTAPEEICFNTTGVFTKRCPGVLWLGTREEPPSLNKLIRDLNLRFTRLGFPDEKKKFKTHITIGRVKKIRAGSDFINNFLNEKIKLSPFEIKKISLIQSCLTPEGAIYETVCDAPFKS